MYSKASRIFEIVKRTHSLLEDYPKLVPTNKEEAEQWVKQWREMGSEYVEWTEVPYDTWFDGKARVYLPIDEVEEAEEVEPPSGLEDVLEHYGFEVLDLEKGLARSLDPKNAKNTYGIGKILARYTKDVQKTGDTNQIEKAKNLVDDLSKYLADVRKQKGVKTTVTDEDHLIVISRDPMDIMLMSEDRGWASCMRFTPNPWNSYHIPAFILRAGLIAYKIDKEDTEINHPLARILILPYQKASGGLYLSPAKYEYSRAEGGECAPSQDMMTVVRRWLESKQGLLGETARAPYMGLASSKKNPKLLIYDNGDPTILSPNDPRAPGVIEQTLKEYSGASLVASWLVQGKIRPTTDLLSKRDAGGHIVASVYAQSGKGIRSTSLLMFVFDDGHPKSIMGLAVPAARFSDYVRYVEKTVANPEMLDLPAERRMSTVIDTIIASPHFANLDSRLVQSLGKIAEQKYPSVFSDLVINGYVAPPDVSWYSRVGHDREANMFSLLNKIAPDKLGEIPPSVFTSRLLKMENRQGQSLAFLLLQYMLKNRVAIQHLPSVKAIKEVITSSVPVMSMMTTTSSGDEPLVCWWAKNRKVFWTDDPRLLPLRSVPQGGRTLAHIIAENYEKNKWVPADRKVLNWVYEEEGRSVSVRDILISKGATQGLGAVAQPRKRVGGNPGADDLGESTQRRKRRPLTELVNLFADEDDDRRESTLKALKNPRIRKLLDQATDGHFRDLEVDDRGYVNYQGDINLSYMRLKKIPVPFGTVGGGFYCSDNQLQTLEGAPESVGGGFSCPGNQLQTLEGAPESVGGNFYCAYNQLQTLEGAPESVGGSFNCSDNQLQTLEGAPTSVGGSFYGHGNRLQSLRGAPESVGGNFDCAYNQLQTLEGAPASVGGDFYCAYNQLQTLEGAPESVGGYFWCYNNQLQTLEGAPTSVGGDFNCYSNQLTSLQGAPTSVGGGFYCSENPDLPEEEVRRYRESKAVRGRIYESRKQNTQKHGINELVNLFADEDDDRRESTLKALKDPRIRKLLNQATEGHFHDLEVDDRGYVNYRGDISLSYMYLEKIPVPFGTVGGYFDCAGNQLQTLEGAPKSVGRGFNCSRNQLTSLQGAPASVGGGFFCAYNQLQTLEGAPESVSGDFNCSDNQLQTLEGAPKSVGGYFYCAYNQLQTLEGAPKSVGGDFFCHSNRLTSLQGAPESVGGGFHCSGNQLQTLEGAPESVGGNFFCHSNRLTSLQGAPESVGGGFFCHNNQLQTLEGAPESVSGDFNCSENPDLPEEEVRRYRESEAVRGNWVTDRYA